MIFRSSLLVALSAFASGLFACVASPGEPDPVGRAAAASHACSSPMDRCDDGDLCTTDRCDVLSRRCEHLPITNCCARVEDCPPRSCQRILACEPTDSPVPVCIYSSVLGCEGGVPDEDGGVVDPGRDMGSGRRDGGHAEVDASATESDGGSTSDQEDGGPEAHVRGGACSATGSAATPWLLSWMLLLFLGRGRRRIGSVAAALLVVGITSVPRAEAQGPFRIGPTTPSLPDDLSLVERAAPKPVRLQPTLRIGASYQDDPLIAELGDQEAPLVGERLGFSLAASLAFRERFHLAVGASLLVQDGFGSCAVDAEAAQLDHVALGAPTVEGRVVVLDRRAPLELAVAATLRLPLGADAGFARDARASLWPRVLVARSFDERGSFAGLSLGVDVRPRATLGDLEVAPGLTFALGGAAAIGDHSAITLELAGSTVLRRAFDGAHTPLRATAGLRWARDPFTVHVWSGLGLSPGFGTPDALFGLDFGWRLPFGRGLAAPDPLSVRNG